MTARRHRTTTPDPAPPPDEPSLLPLTIELRGSKPRIWRRLLLPGDLTLDVVHTLFQAAMGWADSHLNRFKPGLWQSYTPQSFVTNFAEQAVRLCISRADVILVT